jgi:hypothetical protein
MANILFSDIGIIVFKRIPIFGKVFNTAVLYSVTNFLSEIFFCNFLLYQSFKSQVIKTTNLLYCTVHLDDKGAGTLVDVLQLSYSFHQNCSKLGTAITEDFKN